MMLFSAVTAGGAVGNFSAAVLVWLAPGCWASAGMAANTHARAVKRNLLSMVSPLSFGQSAAAFVPPNYPVTISHQDLHVKSGPQTMTMTADPRLILREEEL